MKKLACLSLIFFLSFFMMNTTYAHPNSPDRLAKIIQIQGKANVENALNAAKAHPTNQLELGILFFKLAEEKRHNQDKTWIEDLKKAYTILSILKSAPQLEESLKPYLGSYHAAAMAWLGANTYKTSLVTAAWQAFDQLEEEYGKEELIVGLLQAKIAAELPYFHNRKHFAKKVLTQMIEQYESNSDISNPLLMAQIYRYWVQLNPKKTQQAKRYLEKATILERQAV